MSFLTVHTQGDDGRNCVGSKWFVDWNGFISLSVHTLTSCFKIAAHVVVQQQELCFFECTARPFHILFDSITASAAVRRALSKQNAISYSTKCQYHRRYQCPHLIQRGKWLIHPSFSQNTVMPIVSTRDLRQVTRWRCQMSDHSNYPTVQYSAITNVLRIWRWWPFGIRQSYSQSHAISVHYRHDWDTDQYTADKHRQQTQWQSPSTNLSLWWVLKTGTRYRHCPSTTCYSMEWGEDIVIKSAWSRSTHSPSRFMEKRTETEKESKWIDIQQTHWFDGATWSATGQWYEMNIVRVVPNNLCFDDSHWLLGQTTTKQIQW